ncbi:ribosome biogenesis GTPase Der [bacterium]|nr:ribosome biogenesis GTPase Der [bacterium]
MRAEIPTISIVGRPNVGKSTLFNRMVRRKKAIVMNTPGITRDRNYEVARLGDFEVPVMLVDTGGFLRDAPDEMTEAVGKQVEFAIAESDAIIFMVDGRSGLVPQDEEVAAFLRPMAGSVVLVVNKIDTPKHESLAAEFYALGFEKLFSVSAEHNLGIGELADRLLEIVSTPDAASNEDEGDGITRCAIVGRPNVGKSSIVNALLGKDRVLVHDVAGTTRDAVDSVVRCEKKEYMLIDTAGIRRRSKITEFLEKESMLIAERSIRRSDITLLVLDATDAATSQDQRIASVVVEQGKGLIVVINKWDLIAKDERTMGAFVNDIQQKMAFAAFAPMVFVSAITKQRLVKFFPMIDSVASECKRRIGTGVLNRFARDEVFTKHRMIKRKRPVKFYFMTQASVEPPTFAVFTNRPEDVDEAYSRYIEGCLRAKFSFEGAPIRIHFRKHH